MAKHRTERGRLYLKPVSTKEEEEDGDNKEQEETL